MKSYHDYLKEQLSKFHEIGCLKHLPDIFRLLCDLLDEEAVDKEARAIINMALAYFVNPADVLDEEIYGVAGYIDDMFVCCFALRKLELDYSEYMKKHMPAYKDVLEKCYNESEAYLDERQLKHDVLMFSGLLEKNKDDNTEEG